MNESTRDGDALIEQSGLFDADWYAAQFPDVGMSGMSPSHHYHHYGHLLGRNPSPAFDGDRYLEQNEDVANSGLNPLEHYLKYGSVEGRHAYPTHLPEDQRPQDQAALLQSIHVFEPSDLADGLRARLRELAVSTRVSVIMPTWNRANVISRALRSAFDQSLPPFEVVVADDGSSDGTLAKLRSEFADEIADGRLVLVPGSRGGVSHARNQALERATGDVIAYLDSDNEWHPDHLLFAVGMLAGEADAECAYTAIRVNKAGEERLRILGRRFDRVRLLRGNYIDLNAFVHRRGVYDRLGGFDRSLRRLVDWDLIIRYTAEKDPLHVPVVTVEYYLDAAALGNITYTEKLALARDTIFVKHRDEYIARGILTGIQVDNANRRLIAEKADGTGVEGLDAFSVVLADERQLPMLPDLSTLDTGIVVWVRSGSRYRALSSSASGVLAGSEVDALPAGAYWCPDPAQPMPHPEQLRALYLALATGALDLAVVSYSLASCSDIAAACLRNQIMVSDRLVHDHLAHDSALRLGRGQGKILRMLPSPEASLYQVSVSTLLGDGAVVDQKNLLLHDSATGAAGPLRRRPQLPAPRHAKRKPIVLVLPMKVAVGGVERNTVEIMRALRDRYDFIYVTMEKIQQEQGSLAGQVTEVAHRFIDLAEISVHDHYIDLLRMLKSAYGPDAVWICNGSMWMCKHAMGVREVFDDVPIVDQQVYDVTEGWVRRYTEPGIQSFDRFIAINTRIRDRFIGEFGMDPARVDLIYSAIDSEKFRQRKRGLAPPDTLRAKYELPEDRRSFAFMGRLVDQKRPLDFLEVAARRVEHRDEHYVLVGNGALAPKIEAWLAAHPGVSVQWIPYVENTAEFWSVMSGMLVTSAYEGLPIAMLEALAMGVPVISTDVGDIAPVLADHGGGMVVERIGDVDAFATHMDRFIADLPSLRAGLVEESDRVLDRFSSITIARHYDQCWQAAIAQRDGTREAST